MNNLSGILVSTYCCVIPIILFLLLGQADANDIAPWVDYRGKSDGNVPEASGKELLFGTILHIISISLFAGLGWYVFFNLGLTGWGIILGLFSLFSPLLTIHLPIFIYMSFKHPGKDSTAE